VVELAPGPFVELEVRDTGCGMDDVIQQRLFDPFFTTKAASLGLGMSVVMGAVRSHKGAIFLSSQPNYGTTISMLFPVATAKPTPVIAAPKPPAKIQPSPAPLLAGTVLVVEDEAPIRLLMERILKRLGLQVLTATDGHEAIVQFRQHADEITFVILDFMMPKLDGLKTLVELRRVRLEVKAVLTSGYNVEQLNRDYAQEGFAAFIQKPFQVETLMKVARQMCAKT
jgi:two-component system cell cycle sensor histidine kinase/response regulator CckA